MKGMVKWFENAPLWLKIIFALPGLDIIWAVFRIVKGAAYGLVLTDDENKWWGGRMEQPKVAICPKCGEVSIYLDNTDKLKNK